MAKAETLKFRRVSQLNAKMSRALCKHECSYSGAIGELSCSVEMLSAMKSTVPKTTLVYLDVSVENTSVSIGLDEPLFAKIANSKLDFKVAEKLPKELLLAVMTNSTDKIAADLSQALNIQVMLSDVSLKQSIPHELALKCKFSDGLGYGYLNATSMLLDTVEKLPKKEKKNNIGTVPFFVGLSVGRSILPMSVVETLRTGDVVFIQEIVDANKILVRITSEFVFYAEIYDNCVTVIQRASPMNDQELPDLPDEYDDEDEDEEEVRSTKRSSELDLSSMKVELLFEVGQHKMTVSELQELRPGYIFELNRSIDKPVNIVANGKVIGICELVNVENRVGAKIIELK